MIEAYKGLTFFKRDMYYMAFKNNEVVSVVFKEGQPYENLLAAAPFMYTQINDMSVCLSQLSNLVGAAVVANPDNQALLQIVKTLDTMKECSFSAMRYAEVGLDRASKERSENN